MPQHKIIFDTDPGIDDAMALLFAHRAPTIELLGITTVLGNGTIDAVTQNALFLCEQFGIEAPVHQGASAPLVVAEDEPPAFVHGDDALGNIHADAPNRQVASTDAAQFIVDTVNLYPNQVTLVAVGRMTNLALALQRQPSIAEKVKQVVIMGGALGTNEFTGNVTPVAEANIYGDPHAADLVACAGWPLVVAGLDVTMQSLLGSQRLRRICDRVGDVGDLLWRITRHYQAFYTSRHGGDGFPVHDSVAVAYLLAPELFQVQSGPMRVITDGISRGQTIQVPADRHFPPSGWDDVEPSLGCVGVDVEGLLTLYENTVAL